MKPDPVLPPLPMRLGLPLDTSNAAARDGQLAQHLEALPLKVNSPAQHPGGAPFVLKDGKR